MLPPLRRRSVLRYALGVVVLLGLLVSWRVWQVRGDLLQARDYAEALRAAGDERDLPDARVALASLEVHAGDAADGTRGPSWWLLEHLPLIGDDARAVATSSQALSEVARAGRPLLNIVEEIDRGSLSPEGGRLPLDRIEAIGPPLSQFSDAVIDARDEIAGLNGSYVGRLSTALDELSPVLDDLSATVARTQTAVTEAPVLLGADKPMRYLLVFQNNGEIRATGGLPGSAAEVIADRGRLRLRRTFSPIDRDVVAPAEFRLSSAERTLYGPLLQRHTAIFLNSMPDRSRAASLFAEGAQAWLGQRVDGVILMDTVTLGYLLQATGPVSVEGVRLDATNAVRELLYGTYARFPRLADQDRFFGSVSSAIFERITGRSVDVAELAGALRRSFSEQRSYLYLRDRARDSALRDIAGSGSPSDLEVGLNDVGGGKMSYFLRSRIQGGATCGSTRSSGSFRVQLTSEAPLDASRLPDRFENAGEHWQPVRDGAQIVQVVAMLPRGWSVTRVDLGSRPVAFRSAAVGGREVVTFQTEVLAQETDTATIEMRGTPGDAFGDVWLTPGVTAGGPSVDAQVKGC
ncbi:DUF4012 domain-containing protein [Nocardioides fonticola]